jgi:hypothetical protein
MIPRKDIKGSVIACGGQIVPGICKYADEAEVSGLIAPRALLVQNGRYDSVVPAAGAIRTYRYLKKLYAVAGAPEKVELDVFEGVHEFNIPRIFDFFDRWLKKQDEIKR